MSSEDPEVLYRVLEGLKRSDLAEQAQALREHVRGGVLDEDAAKLIILKRKPWPFTRTGWSSDIRDMPATEQWRVGLNGVERALEAMLTDERGCLRFPPPTTIAAERLIYRVLHPEDT